jgi:hypothetical protein
MPLSAGAEIRRLSFGPCRAASEVLGACLPTRATRHWALDRQRLLLFATTHEWALKVYQQAALIGTWSRPKIVRGSPL